MERTEHEREIRQEAVRRYRKTEKGIASHEKSLDKLKEKGYFKWRHLFKSYGLTKITFFAILRGQRSLCPICNELLNLDDIGGKSISVDHNHDCCKGSKSCGKCICGLLHRECNAGIGKLRDDAGLCDNAASYLRKTRV